MSIEALSEKKHFVDLCIIGGGLAGLCAAVAAARHGTKVALVQDRPVLGGNASSEIRMWALGCHGENNRETGILEEILLENMYRNPNRNFSIWDSILYEKVKFEPNISLILNCSCNSLVMEGNTIISIRAWQLTTYTWHTIEAKYFADCSGDSVLAPLCGAEFRVGREASSEFGEDIAPDVADKKTMVKITDLIIPLTYDMKLLEDIVSKKLNIELNRIEQINIINRTVNALNKQDIHFKMSVAVYVLGDEDEIVYKNKNKSISKDVELVYKVPKRNLKERPIVVGCGPAGMFAALILAQAGENPILLERGLDVDSRRQSVLKFWGTGVLDTSSNVQFGEGGAGAFSDGKLKTGKKDFRKIKVLSELVEAGAPPEIMYLSKPHIGTDRLNETVKRIRQKTISLGGEVRFNATVTEIQRKNGQITGVRFVENGEEKELSTDNVVLAIGHSARDTFDRLLKSGVIMEQKPFAMGVRVEHPQKMIDKIQYGDFTGHPALGAADYRMVVHLGNGRGVYTFCMCPGGTVVAATSEDNCLVTNGMSEYNRDGRNANTALLVTIDKKDLGSDHPLAGVMFQRRVEAAAFNMGGGGYKAPVQRLEDFIKKRVTKAFGDVLPTYLPGTEFACVDSYMPDFISDSLRQAITEMGLWMPGFEYPDALLTGAETRSSSPVRMTRGDNLEAIGIKGLYPCGEGAGYAGGIISAAVDGVLCAEKILGC